MKTPSKPKPTSATVEQLIAHFNKQVPAYNAVILGMPEKKRPLTGLQQPATHDGELILVIEDGIPTYIDREDLVLLIRRQNYRLKRHIKQRSLELLYEKVRETSEMTSDLEEADKDRPLVLKDGKFTVGHTYQRVLEILRDEFPEASTSVACLRWYVVHEREEARDQGLDWPDFPHFRPRSSEKEAAA